jgi:hypothetical protein
MTGVPVNPSKLKYYFIHKLDLLENQQQSLVHQIGVVTSNWTCVKWLPDSSLSGLPINLNIFMVFPSLQVNVGIVLPSIP